MEEMASRKPAGHTPRPGRTKKVWLTVRGHVLLRPRVATLSLRLPVRSWGVPHPYTATGHEHHRFIFEEARQYTCSNCCLGRSSGRLHWARLERATRLTGDAGPARRPGCRRVQLMLGSADVFS